MPGVRNSHEYYKFQTNVQNNPPIQIIKETNKWQLIAVASTSALIVLTGCLAYHAFSQIPQTGNEESLKSTIRDLQQEIADFKKNDSFASSTCVSFVKAVVLGLSILYCCVRR